jgi:Regulator of chromosome condensation (RCC1) repeat
VNECVLGIVVGCDLLCFCVLTERGRVCVYNALSVCGVHECVYFIVTLSSCVCVYVYVYVRILTSYCALLMVLSQGSSAQGQCGLGSTEKQDQPLQVVALESVRVKCVAAGPKTSGCVSTEGEVFLWGSNDHAQLGVVLSEDASQSTVPVLVKSLSLKGVKKISLGLDHSVALCGNGTVYTWGDGSLGCLGHGDDEDQSEPRLMQNFGDHPILDVCTGERHNLALTSDGRIHSWVCAVYVCLCLCLHVCVCVCVCISECVSVNVCERV